MITVTVELTEAEVAAVLRMRRESEAPKPKTDARGVPVCTYCHHPVTSTECQRSHP